MADGWFGAIQEEHGEVKVALDLLAASLEAARESESSPRLVEGIGAFLEFYQRSLAVHMRHEEASVYPLLERYVPREIGSADAMLQEHRTAEALVALLVEGMPALRAGVPAAVSRAASVAQDLLVLLREHMRKEDDVINPLLLRLIKEAR